jgi:RHS repeat-associated protein
VQYGYDAEGKRITKSFLSGPSTVYVYDVFGSLAAEYSSAPLTTAPVCGTCYLSTDHLGSTRLVTGENGSVMARHDYLPFGEEIPSGYANRGADWAADDSVKQKFTGKERDAETQLDFFQARYYSAAQGRFNSPDPMNAGADPTNPQSWNGYAYVLNNPLASVDPDGLSCVQADDGSYVDDNDGLGCDAAGAGPNNPNDPGQGLNQGQTNAQTNAQQISIWDYLWTISTNEIPRYVENDTPLSDQARFVITATYVQTQKMADCIGVPLTTGGAGGALIVGGQPSAGFKSPVTGKLVGSSKPFATPGASGGSSTISSALRDALPQRLPMQVPTPVGGPGTGRALGVQGSNRLGAILGRYAPFVGIATTAYSLYKLNTCLAQ